MDLPRFRESEDCSSEDAVHKVYSRKRDLSALYGRDLDLTASFYVRPAEEQKERMSSLSSGSGGDEDAKNRSRKARTAFSDSQLGLLEVGPVLEPDLLTPRQLAVEPGALQHLKPTLAHSSREIWKNVRFKILMGE